MLPPSPFFRYAMNNSFFLIDGKIYPLKYMEDSKIQSRPIKLDIFEKIYLTDLEKEFTVEVQANDTKNYRLAKFVIEDLIEEKFSLNEIDFVISSVLPKFIMVNKGEYYILKTDMRGKVKVAGKKFISEMGPLPVPYLEKKYLETIEKKYFRKGLVEILKDGEYYDSEKDIGFLINKKDFYAFTKVKPYVLYERLNGKYYKFDETKVGTRLKWILGNIYWGDLKVLNNYTHPSLSQENEAFQVICVGDYKYGSIRNKYPNNLKKQVLEVLKKGRKVLTTEYLSSNRSWHRLIENKFSSQEIKGDLDLKVLNY
jgi:hypothetical protein